MQPHHSPTMSLLFLLITIPFLWTPSPTFAAEDERYLNCSAPFRCGNIPDIGYPFWGSSRANYCGLPELELDCSGSTALMKISELSYHVLNYNNVSGTITVARADYRDTLCPTSLKNTSLDSENIFTPTGDTQNMTLLYNCSNIPGATAAGSPFHEFRCDITAATGVLNYFTTSELAARVPNLGSCEKNVNVLANRSAVQPLNVNPSAANLISTLGQGFGVQWNIRDDKKCVDCESSGGQCGFDPATPTGFVCFCPDKPSESTCPRNPASNQRGKSGKSNKVTLVVGLGIAGLAIVGGFLGGCLVIKRRKRRNLQIQSKELQAPPSAKSLLTTPSTDFTASIPSYPSSKTDLEKGSTYFGVAMFTYSELEEATNNFDSSRELGDGGFGIVYYGVLKDGRKVAVKRLYENNMKRAEQFMNEVEILARLRHKNLVTLYGCTSRRSRELLLVYEYIPNGTLADHVHGKHSNSGLLTWPVRLSIAIETADALAHLHASDVIHRDVKTNNILLDDKFQVKVADFGLSRLFPNDVTHVSTAPQGTPGYVDPEYYQCYQLTNKSDVYSFGVVLVELISSLQAVDTNRHRHDINLANMAVNKIQNHELHEMVDPSLGFEKEYAVRTMITSVAGVAFRCLQQERDMRPTMEEVLKDLRRIQNEHYGAEKAEVVDISEDDIGLLKHVHPPLSSSPDSMTDKWANDSITRPISF